MLEPHIAVKGNVQKRFIGGFQRLDNKGSGGRSGCFSVKIKTTNSSKML